MRWAVNDYGEIMYDTRSVSYTHLDVYKRQALGIICIVNAFGVVSLAMKFIGVALIYDGISDLWIVSRTAKAAKAMKQEADALDVDYKEVDD